MRVVMPVLAALSYAVNLIGLPVWVPLTAVVFIATWLFDRTRAIAGQFYLLLAYLWLHSLPLWRTRIEGRWPRGRGAYVVVGHRRNNLRIRTGNGYSVTWTRPVQ
jgi:hypothetical protein